jgi:hypothetical protein
MRKAASHMIFSFPERLKYCQQLLKMSRDQGTTSAKSHDCWNLKMAGKGMKN